MLINVLCQYADLLESSSDKGKVPEGWAEQDIHYEVHLSTEGELVDIIPMAVDENVKKPSKKVFLPKRTQKHAEDLSCRDGGVWALPTV